MEANRLSVDAAGRGRRGGGRLHYGETADRAGGAGLRRVTAGRDRVRARTGAEENRRGRRGGGAQVRWTDRPGFEFELVQVRSTRYAVIGGGLRVTSIKIAATTG